MEYLKKKNATANGSFGLLTTAIEGMQFVSKAYWYNNWRKWQPYWVNLLFCVYLLILLFIFFKLKLIMSYNRVVYYYTRIFLILFPHTLHIFTHTIYLYIYIYIYTQIYTTTHIYVCIYTFTKIYTHTLYIYIYIHTGTLVRVFANGPGDLGSIPGQVIPKTLKMELDTTLLNTQHYKVRFKGKVEQSWEWSSALPYTLV